MHFPTRYTELVKALATHHGALLGDFLVGDANFWINFNLKWLIEKNLISFPENAIFGGRLVIVIANRLNHSVSDSDSIFIPLFEILMKERLPCTYEEFVQRCLMYGDSLDGSLHELLCVCIGTDECLISRAIGRWLELNWHWIGPIAEFKVNPSVPHAVLKVGGLIHVLHEYSKYFDIIPVNGSLQYVRKQ